MKPYSFEGHLALQPSFVFYFILTEDEIQGKNSDICYGVCVYHSFKVIYVLFSGLLIHKFITCLTLVNETNLCIYCACREQSIE